MTTHINPKKKSTCDEYLLRINRVIDFINSHLADELTPQELAHNAPFSVFHFHRIFQAMTGETVSAFVRRIRLESAANQIMHDRTISITEIAMDLGFSTPANFTRAFREQFGITPSAFQKGKKPKIRSRKNVKKKIKEFETEIRSFETFRIAYKRGIGPYDFRIPKIYRELYKWAFPKGLISGDSKIIGIAHDNPHLTDTDKCRYDVGVILENNTKYSDINIMQIDPQLCVCIDYSGPGRKLDEVYDFLYAVWLPESGYQPGSGSVFTLHDSVIFKILYRGGFHGTICLPITPL